MARNFGLKSDNIRKENNSITKNSNINYFKSLAPNDKAEDLEKYSNYINRILKDKENNKNIAISGGYGSGKSSIIKSFFKNNDNVIYVSLGSYISKMIENEKKISKKEENSKSESNINYNNNNVNVCLSEDDNKINKELDEIETSILQQIIYVVRPKKLPFSRISRIDNRYLSMLLKNMIISLLTTLFLVFIFNMFYRKIILDILNANNWYILLYSLIMTIPIMFVFYIIKRVTSTLFLNKVRINNVELSTEESRVSILNRNIDELIHFFMQTKYSIVVFEDIDRLKMCQVIFF